MRTPAGTWRLYVSCATPDTKHWWIEAIDADRPEDFADRPPHRRAARLRHGRGQGPRDRASTTRRLARLDLRAPAHRAQVTRTGCRTAYHRSDDGLVWERHGTVLAPRPGAWDARGARVSDVVSLDPLVVLYDGRPRAEDNWHETTGRGPGHVPGDPGSVLVADDAEPLRSPYSDGACRYAASVTMPDGTLRYYLELARPDGAHDLVTITG